MKIKLLNTSQANFNKRLNDHLAFKQGNVKSVEKIVDKILKKGNNLHDKLFYKSIKALKRANKVND